MFILDSLLWKLGMMILPIFPIAGQFGPLCLMGEIGGGYRKDSVDWNLAGPKDEETGENTPNILSELTWKDLKIAQLHTDFRILGLGKLYLRGVADYGWILSGKNQDSDFHGDDRTEEYMRSVSKAGAGEVYDLSVGVGLPIVYFKCLFISPVGGYSFQGQNLHMFDGKIVVNTKNPESEGTEIQGLDATYDNCWKGPFAGVDGILMLGRLTLLGEWEYHWVHFDGEGKWNLRRDFADPFHDKAKGYGTRACVKGKWGITPRFSLGLGGEYWTMKAENGKSKTPCRVAQVNTAGEFTHYAKVIYEQDFNEVNWHSFRVNASISCVF